MTRNISALIAAMAMASLTHTPLMAQNNYHVNIDETTAPNPDSDRSSRTTNAINLNGTDGSQTVQVNQKAANLVYIKRLDDCFTAKAGETVTPSFSAVMDWMHGYVYVDWGRDGQFDVDFNSSEVTDAKDLVAYTYYKSKNSKGATVTNQNPGHNPPAFVVPEGTPNGFYRVRYKIDWDNVDPGGDATSIVKNGGVIVDTRLNVHGENACLAVSAMEHGTLTREDGTTLASGEVPFGKDLVVLVAPEEGYTISSIRIKHGYNLDGEQTVNDMRQWQEDTMLSFLVKDGKCTIPAKYMDGDVRLTATFAKSGASAGGEYKLGFDKDAEQANPTNTLTEIRLTNADGTSASLALPEGKTVYRDLLANELGAKPGDVITPSVTLDGATDLKAYLYVDYNQDGSFSTELSTDGTATASSELVSFSSHNGKNSLGENATEGVAMPAFTLPEALPTGIYRARLKLDADNIDATGSDGIAAANGYVVDFLLNVHEQNVNVDVRSDGGNIVGYDGSGVAETAQYGKAIQLMPLAPADGYKVERVTVRHGYGLDGEQYVNGNRQWQESDIEDVANDENFTIPAEMVDGDVRVTALFKADGTEEYKLVFADEFNGADGSLPDPAAWHNCTRESPTWKRFTSQTAEGQQLTAFIRDGKLVTRAIKNTIDEEGDVDMISGAIESSDKMYFTYGRIEGRIRTTPHTGNFPAFWLMPQDNSEGWPNAGEIDIWEQIDTENISYHTVHTHVTYDLKQALPNSGNKYVNSSEYHVYTLDWQPELLTWYVDGNKAFSYAKSKDSSLLSKGQWPYTKPFYPILNQSVGNGTWAKPCDVDFTYETLFDYVRLYQTKDMEGTFPKGATAIDIVDNGPHGSSLDAYPRRGGILLVTPETQHVDICNIQGTRVFSKTVQGNVTVSLPKGTYIVANKKVVVR